MIWMVIQIARSHSRAAKCLYWSLELVEYGRQHNTGDRYGMYREKNLTYRSTASTKQMHLIKLTDVTKKRTSPKVWVYKP